MSKSRRTLTGAVAALLLGIALAAPARAIYLEETVEQESTLSSFFEGLLGYLSSFFAASNGHVIP